MKIEIWKNRKLKFWKLQILKNANLEKCIFGKMQLKKNADLEISKSQEMKIWKKMGIGKKEIVKIGH